MNKLNKFSKIALAVLFVIIAGSFINVAKAQAITPPTFIQKAQTAWNTTTSPKDTAAINVNDGDVLVAYTESQDVAQALSISLLTGTGFTFTNQQIINVTGQSYVVVATATVVGTQSIVVRFTRTTGSGQFGGGVLVFRGSGGIGASSKTTGSGTPSLGLTTISANSTIVVANADWNTVDGTSRTWLTVNGITPTSGNGFESTYALASGAYTAYGAYYSDAGAAGAKTLGLSAPTGQAFAIVGVEVLGTAPAPGAYTMMDAGSIIGGSTTDCLDTSAAPCPPTISSVGSATQTSLTVNWTPNTTAGPAQTSFNLFYCDRTASGICSPSSPIGGSITSGTTSYPHNATITCGRTYAYLIRAVNASGTSTDSNVLTGTTSTCTGPPIVTTNAATSITGSSATLWGSFNSNGGTSNTFWWRYGTTNTGDCSTLSTILTGGTWTTFSTNGNSVSVLPVTPYYFCAVASNEFGTTYGGILQFTTPVGIVRTSIDMPTFSGLDIAVGSDGFARIAYNYSTTGDLKFARCLDINCTSKNITTVESINDVGRDPSIALGADGFARIMHWDQTNQQVRFVQCTNADCTTSVITVIGSWSNARIAMSGNLANFVYAPDTTGNNVNFVQCTNAACSTRNTTTISTGTGNGGAQIKMGTDGFARIVYAGSGGSIIYMQCTNASCTTRNSNTIVAGPGALVSDLVISSSDTFARIVYADGMVVKVIQCTNATCTTNLINSIYTYPGTTLWLLPTLIGIGSDGFPRIIYSGTSNSGGTYVHYAQCTNASCSTFVSNDIDGINNGYEMNGAMGSDGFVRAIYRSYSGGQQIVMYARCIDSACTP